MTTAFERLERGELGVRLSVRGFELLDEKPQNFVLRDLARGVLLQFGVMPWRTSLEPMELVIQDVERSSRVLFERTWKETPLSDLERSLGRTEPLGASHGFSPLVSCERVALKGGEGVSLVLRSSYRPGTETVSARVLIPIADGTAELSVTAMDAMTGSREAVLLTAAGLVERPPNFQQMVDDVENDAAFPQHCLSRARAVLRDLLATLEITRAATVPPRQRVALPSSGVSVIPPPRFSLLTQGVLPVAQSHATFTRVGHSVSELPWLFEVARVSLNGGDLEACCRAFYASWGRQGVRQESLEVTGAPSLGGQRTLRARLEGLLADGSHIRSRARWVERGSDAIMLSMSSEWTSPEESVPMLDEAAASLEWLSTDNARPWWRFW